MGTEAAQMMIGLALGSGCGALPLIVSLVRDRLGLGSLAFVLCALVGAVGGGLVALLLAGIMVAIILTRPVRSAP